MAYKKWRVNWMLIEQWLQDCKIYNKVESMILDKVHNVELFDDIFGYSIFSLNKLVSQLSR
jgi:hypothetical protein